MFRVEPSGMAYCYVGDGESRVRVTVFRHFDEDTPFRITASERGIEEAHPLDFASVVRELIDMSNIPTPTEYAALYALWETT